MARVVEAHLLIAGTRAQDDDIDIRSPDDADVTILPRPNSGTAPQTPGDPGGWQQLMLLVLIVAALVVIFLLVRRQMRRARASA